MKQQFFPQRLFMDMKRLIINRLVGLGLLVVGALVSCNAPTAFVPVPSPNPWVDDYTALSSMENYKQWGTTKIFELLIVATGLILKLGNIGIFV